MMPPDLAELVDALRADVRRRDRDRYPIQHATAAFHLGTALISAGLLDEAITNLSDAAALFPVDRLPVEHAKATNMRGVARRDRGDWHAAAEDFGRAAALFAEAGHRLEEAAGWHNQGLALRDGGDLAGAAAAFEHALATFVEADLRDHAGMTARELGLTRYTDGDLDGAADALDRAMDLARRAGDREALGVAANTRGIVHLAAEEPGRALEMFEQAVGAHPRTVRPAEHAMARANLALAADRTGQPDHAVLAARQALAIPDAAPEVAALARDVLARLGDDPQVLVRVLEAEPSERHVGILRAELTRIAALTDRGAHDRCWVRALAADPERGLAWAEAWLEVVLEQPPEAFDASVRATVQAIGELDRGDRGAAQPVARHGAVPRSGCG